MPPIVAEIEQLRNRILEMGALVEAALGNAICSLRERTGFPATEILASEPKINHLEMLIDESAMRLLALHQPVAGFAGLRYPDRRYL